MGLLTQEQLFLAVGFPRGDRRAVQVDSNGFAGGQGCFNGVVLDGDSGLWERGTHADGRGFVGAVHCVLGVDERKGR